MRPIETIDAIAKTLKIAGIAHTGLQKGRDELEALS